ncbi:MAG: hypothetical protein K0S10_3086, partial [Rubrobacteraceae bacterium]|nr:hypothetical protein [Rubrobacteraceae bacterium]
LRSEEEHDDSQREAGVVGALFLSRESNPRVD